MVNQRVDFCFTSEAAGQIKAECSWVCVSVQGSPLFDLLRQEQEGETAEQVETTASFSQPLQHNHTAADLWVAPVHEALTNSPP